MYSVTEGESVNATVSVMSDDVTLDRDVVVMVMTSDGTADSGIVYMPTCTCTCMVVEFIHVQCSYSAVYIACKYNTVVYMCYSVYHYVPISLQLTSW